jgi:hypothetical protein
MNRLFTMITNIFKQQKPSKVSVRKSKTPYKAEKTPVTGLGSKRRRKSGLMGGNGQKLMPNKRQFSNFTYPKKLMQPLHPKKVALSMTAETKRIWGTP